MLSWIPRVAHGNVKSINLVERKQSQVNDSHYNGEVGRAAQLNSDRMPKNDTGYESDICLGRAANLC